MGSWKLRLRQLHRALAPMMVVPLLITLLTGILFQTAIAAGRSGDFLWLLEFHRGHFGPLNLQSIYPYLNGLGLLVMVVTGMVMWFQRPKRRRVQS
ncbi:hypothetical protein [Leptolyngbya sp. PCC 6406]|uniref:hypothetical protein n=1 Tax=Leptolyngbya sp. PCC 6406 TaxID=1173264 RepID=UPI0002ACF623|nr:hypothetical protein [Leptolyngbya sp. PCC 6406]